MAYSSDEDLIEIEDRNSLWRELPFQEEAVESISNNAELMISLPRVLQLNEDPTSSSSSYGNALDVFAAAFSRTIVALSIGIAARRRYLDELSTERQEYNDEAAARASWLRLVASGEQQPNLADETLQEDNITLELDEPAAPSIDLEGTPESSPRPILGRWTPEGVLRRPIIIQEMPRRPLRPIRGRRLTFFPAMNIPHSNHFKEEFDSNFIIEDIFLDDDDNASEAEIEEQGYSSPLIEEPLAEDGENASHLEEVDMEISTSLIEQNLEAEDEHNVSNYEEVEMEICSPLIKQPSEEDGDNASKVEGDEVQISTSLIEQNLEAVDGHNASNFEEVEIEIYSPLIKQPSDEDGDNVSKEEGDEP